MPRLQLDGKKFDVIITLRLFTLKKITRGRLRQRPQVTVTQLFNNMLDTVNEDSFPQVRRNWYKKFHLTLIDEWND